ncbi:MAG: exo-alpha-sialidase [Bryobacterales bacterium]|nr:exo-alpha-sialidase [Bryobacterales bacterium]
MRFAIGIAAALVLFANELRIERVFGPEVPTGPYKHPANIGVLRNGDLYLVYYGGAGEYAVDTGVFGSRLRKGETKWSQPERIAHDPFRSVGNAVVWQAPDGLVWLFYVVRDGDTWSTSRIQGKVSRDEGETWSDSFMISDKEGMMVRNKPIVLSSGEYLLPVYHEVGGDTEMVGAGSTSRFLRFDPKSKAKEWIALGVIRSKKGNIQPGVVELGNGHLIAYCRRGGGYGPMSDGYAIYAESHDGGKTWNEGADSQFPNPNSALEFLKLRSGNLLLIFNDSMYQRTPLTAALSTDGGKTWPYRKNIAAEPKQSYAYPAAAQDAEGRVHLVYTSNNRSEIHHAVFEENWVREKQ